MADRGSEEKRRSSNYNYYAGPGGVMAGRAGGYERSPERYRERVRDGGQSFPNKRRRIITGKDLTTPLVGRARVTDRHKKVKFVVRIVNLPKAKMPWGFIFNILIAGAALCVMLLSYIILFETDYEINRKSAAIRAAHTETNFLERQLEIAQDSAELLKAAREDLGMVDEQYIQKKYIRTRTKDRVVMAEKNNGFMPEALTAVLDMLRRDE